MNIFKLLFLLIYTSLSFGQIHKVIDGRNQKELDVSTFISSISPEQIFVLGEFHNTNEIQNAQAELIEKIVTTHLLQERFTLHWEFLNYTEQENITKLFQLLKLNKVSAEDFINQTAGKQNDSYIPIIKTVSNLKGDINGINLPRHIKQQILNDGIDSIDPNYVSPYHYTGGRNYYDRFLEAMGEHVPENEMAKYFEVQCLVDSTMAYQVYLNTINHIETISHFIVAGSFHTDFHQATIERLSKLSGKNIISFKFVSKTHQTKDEIKEFIKGHFLYKEYADYIIITD